MPGFETLHDMSSAALGDAAGSSVTGFQVSVLVVVIALGIYIPIIHPILTVL